MTLPILNWQSLCDYRDQKFMVKGTRISQAIYGWRGRYALVEIRQYGGDVVFAIADAEAASDAHYKAGGEAPLLAGRYDNLDEPIALIDAWSRKRLSELQDDAEPDADFARDRQQDEASCHT